MGDVDLDQRLLKILIIWSTVKLKNVNSFAVSVIDPILENYTYFGSRAPSTSHIDVRKIEY